MTHNEKELLKEIGKKYPYGEWKIIPDYPDYAVCSSGQIVNLKTNKLRKFSNHKGYVQCMVRKEGKSYNKFVHRLVANAFLSKPLNGQVIDHINGVRDDNRLENLRWCTNKENQNFELARINNSNALKGKKQSKESVEKRAKTLQKSIGKKVNQFTLDGSFIRSFNSFNEAARITGVWEASIRNCCIGKYQHAGGYIWKFPEVTFENSPQQVEVKLVN